MLETINGSEFFSKLDLRSSYHHIRMHDEDKSKTTFMTHDRYYEYVVMHFGLTNAPSTFQGSIKDIVRAILRKLVLVFFDDILVYR